MQILFFDIASHKSIVACCTDDTVVSSRTCDTRVGDAELVSLVEDALKEAGWKYADLTHVACVKGPGGFTGLRITAAFINTLADQLGIPSAGIHMSDYYRARTTEEDCIWLHSTKKTELFVRGFGAHEHLWPEPTLIELDQLIESFPKEALWTGELLPEHQDQLGALHAEAKDPVTVLPAFLSGVSYARDLVLPWYGRGW